MSLVLLGEKPNTYELKNSQAIVLSLILKSTNIEDFKKEWLSQHENRAIYEGEPIAIDLEKLPDKSEMLLASDFQALNHFLSESGLFIAGIKSDSEEQIKAAKEAGIGLLTVLNKKEKISSTDTSATAAEIAFEQSVSFQSSLVIDKPLRSGQQVYGQGRDVILLARANSGSEILSDGSIYAYSFLGGRALAGIKGFTGAQIFAGEMCPELVSIAGLYSTTDGELLDNIWGKKATLKRVYENSKDKLLFKVCP